MIVDTRATKIKILVEMYNNNLISQQGLIEVAADILNIPIDCFNEDIPTEPEEIDSRFDILDL